MYVHKVIQSGSLIQSRQEHVATSDENGVVSFTVPRNSTAWINGNFYAGSTSFNVDSGVSVAVPDSATATLESLGAAVTVPTQGLTVKSNGSALAHLIGTLDFSSDFTLTESPTGEANISLSVATVVSNEAVQDALSMFFPDSGAYDWTYDDAGNRESLVIAPATGSVNGLMSAADKVLVDAIPSTYATIANLTAEAAARAASDALLVPQTRTVNGHALSGNVSVTPTDLGLVIGTNVQAWDTDLDAIAALAASNDDIIQRKSGVWANRSIAQLKADLSLSGTNTGDQDLSGYGLKASSLAQFAATTSLELKTLISDETGSGALVFATSPALVTPTLGVATATSINKVALTAPATSATLTILDGKTLTVNKSLTFDGTDGTTMTFPSTSATIARTDAANSFAGTQTFTGQIANTLNGALSAPAVLISGTPVATGGTATTTKPLVLIETAGATSTGWSLTGTMFGVNAPSGFTGRLIDFQLNGATRMYLSSGGAAATLTGFYSAVNTSFNTGAGMTSPSDKVWEILDWNDTGVIRLNFAGNTASFPALKRSGATLLARLADDSAPTALLASRLVTAKTGNYSVLAADTQTFFTNTGAAGAVNFTLPTAAAGLTFEFYIDAAQTVTVTAGASTTIRVGASVTAAAGNVSANTVGNRIRLVAISATQWVGDSTGTWTFT